MGRLGRGPGEFRLPHSIWVTKDNVVYVADRENNRIQVFDSNGNYLDEWTDVHRPDDIYVGPDGNMYVAELGERVGRIRGMSLLTPDSPWATVGIWSLDGKLLARLGGEHGCDPGSFYAPHGICVDSRNDIYVGEDNYSAGIRYSYIPEDCHVLQKFVRV